MSSGVEGSCGRGGENNAKGNGIGVEGEARAPAGELLLVREAGEECESREREGRKQIGSGMLIRGAQAGARTGHQKDAALGLPVPALAWR